MNNYEQLLQFQEHVNRQAQHFEYQRANPVFPEAFLLALGGFILILLTIVLVIHIFSAIVYMKLGTKAGVKNSWVAFLPYGYGIVGVQMKKWFWAVGLLPMVLFFIDSPGLVLLLSYAWFVFIDYVVFETFGENPSFAFFHLLPGIGSLIVMIKLATMAFGKAQIPKAVKAEVVTRVEGVESIKPESIIVEPEEVREEPK